MPNWEPNWEDVEFDHGAAQAAAAQCRLSAGALDTGFTGVATAVTKLATDGAWTGAYQVEFDTARIALGTDASGAADDLRTLAGAIESAATAATAEQNKRERDRDRWRTQKAAEDAARVPRNRPPI
jgi:hypothetical protein